MTRYKPSLTDSEYKYLSRNYFETSNLWLSAKYANQKFYMKQSKMLGEPKCPNRRLSNFLDLSLEPLTKHVKSNIEVNIEFLKTGKQNVTDYTALVSFNVCSLYTNILPEFRLRAIEYFLANYNKV